MKVFKATEGLMQNLRAFVKEDEFKSVVNQLETMANQVFDKTTEPESKVETLYLADYELESGKSFDFSFSKNDFILEEETESDLAKEFMRLCDINKDMVENLLEKYNYAEWIGVTVLITTQKVEDTRYVVRNFRGTYKPENAMAVFGNLTREGLKVLGDTLIPFADSNAYKYLIRVI